MGVAVGFLNLPAPPSRDWCKTRKRPKRIAAEKRTRFDTFGSRMKLAHNLVPKFPFGDEAIMKVPNSNLADGTVQCQGIDLILSEDSLKTYSVAVPSAM